MPTRRETLALAAAAPALAALPAGAAETEIPIDRRPGGMRKSYLDSRLGQIHLRYRVPETTSHPPLLMLHQTPASGRVWEEIMPLLANDRACYAPDTPGLGNSDIPMEKPSIGDYADAMEDVIAALGLETFDILGYHTGASIATELAVRHPDRVRRLVLNGIAVFNEQERAEFEAQPWPRPWDDEGDFVVKEWESTKSWRGAGQSIEALVHGYLDKLRAGETGWWVASAVFAYPLAEKLRQVEQPVLAMRVKDDLYEIATRAEPLIENATWLDMPEYGFGLWQADPERLAGILRDFLDAA